MFKAYFNVVFFILFFSAPTIFAESEKSIKIGAGSVLEGYYIIGLKLCHYISEANEGVKCEVIPTTGTLENIWLLQRGKIDFAFVQSNLALNSYNGIGYFIDIEPFKDMYQLLRLHNEIFTVLVKDKDKILVFGDLDGKKISNGPPKSDSSVTYTALASYYDFKKEPVDIELNHEEYAREFCNGNIDAIMMMTGHPNALINHITHSCECDFVTIEKDKIELLLKNNPGFFRSNLESDKYIGITQNSETVGVSAIFVTNKSVDKKLVENFINYFKGKEQFFKLSHPALYELENSHFTSEFILPGFDIKEIKEN